MCPTTNPANDQDGPDRKDRNETSPDQCTEKDHPPIAVLPLALFASVRPRPFVPVAAAWGVVVLIFELTAGRHGGPCGAVWAVTQVCLPTRPDSTSRPMFDVWTRRGVGF